MQFFEMNDSTTDTQKHRVVLKGMLMLLTVIVFIAATTWLDSAPHLHSAPWSRAICLSFLNALPGLLLALLLLALIRRLVLAFGVVFVIQVLLYTISGLKEKYLGVPLLPNDFYMISQLRSGREIFEKYAPHSFTLAVGLVAAIAVILLLARFEPPLFSRSIARRIAIAAPTLILFTTCVYGVAWWSAVYSPHRMTWAPWDVHVMRADNGMIGNLVLLHTQLDRQPAHADLDAVHSMLTRLQVSGHAPPTTPITAPLPDIVVIQSESLFDPAIVKGFEDNSQILPVIDAWRKRSAHGRLFVPTFGGLTIRTEFETLTGLPLNYLSNMTYPYLQVRTPIIPSIVQLLKAHGYRTVALHPNNPDFWNRGQTFKAMDFDRFISLDKFAPANRKPVYGRYLADSAMTDQIMDTLPTSGCPMFLFAISIEAHGPYDSDTGLNIGQRKAMPVPKGIPAKSIAPWQRYLLHIHHADFQLGRLIQFLQQRSRPALVLFYGDHLPGLGPVFSGAGFKDGFPASQQPGLWLLIDPKHTKPHPERDVAAWMLPGMLLHRIGIDDSDYFNLTRKTGRYLLYQTRAIGAKVHPPKSAIARQLTSQMRNAAFIRLHQAGTVFDVPQNAAHACAMSSVDKAASPGMAAPLAAAEVSIHMLLASTPTLTTDGNAVQVTVDITNNGSATLTSTGKYPVHLGAHLLNATGTNVNNDFARGNLSYPLRPAGTEAITISLPASALAGHSVALLPVQEHVAWFNHWNVAPLKVGPFTKCGKQASELCLPSGKQLQTVQ